MGLWKETGCVVMRHFDRFQLSSTMRGEILSSVWHRQVRKEPLRGFFFVCEKSRTFEGVRRMSEATDRPTRTEKPQISKQIYMGVISSDSLSKNAWVHLFNSGLYSMWWSFYNQLRLSYFPLAFRLFPPWGINQNLSERKIKTRPYWIWSGFVLYSMHGY